MPRLKVARPSISIAEIERPARARRAPIEWHPPIIYYLRFRDLAKIGLTRKLAHRLKAIPNDGLLAIEFGDIALERQRHRQFGHLRHIGEWFQLNEELAGHIVDVRAAFAQEHGMSTEAWYASQPWL